MKETAEGNTFSFEVLYSMCGPHVSSFLTTRYYDELDPDDIDSLVNEAMHRVWLKGGACTADTDKKARNWILTIANNLAHDLMRTKKRAQEIEQELDDERMLEGNPADSYDHYSRDLVRFFERLTPRETLVARLLAAGYRDVDIAEELRISKTRVHQFKEQIRAKAETFFEPMEREY